MHTFQDLYELEAGVEVNSTLQKFGVFAYISDNKEANLGNLQFIWKPENTSTFFPKLWYFYQIQINFILV